MCGQADWKRRWRVERRTLRRHVGQPRVAACETGHLHEGKRGQTMATLATPANIQAGSPSPHAASVTTSRVGPKNGEIPDALGRLELEFLTSPVRTEEHKL
jgi:hypothetical protein